MIMMVEKLFFYCFVMKQELVTNSLISVFGFIVCLFVRAGKVRVCLRME
jgi:hypothetical protein